jgi:RNA polymerase sigma-70 factor, ECF subfamily
LETNNKVQLVALMKKYGTEVKRLIYTYVNDEKTAEDLTQDTFVKVYKEVHNFEFRSDINTWITRIAINVSKDYLKSAFYKKFLLTRSSREEDINENTSNSPEQISIQKEVSDELFKQVLKLPIKYKEVIILFYYKDYSALEISKILNTPTNTIKTRLSRAKKKLQEKLVSKEEQEWVKSYMRV